MAHESNEGPHDSFNIKYLLAILVVALLFPLMHIFVGISVYVL